MTALSATSIANMALSHLRQEPIRDLDESSNRAEVCNMWYDQSRQELLNSHTWNFALARSIRAKDVVSTAEFGYLYSYSLPKDFIRFMSIGDGITDYDYQIEGNRILTNDDFSDGLQLRYIRDVEDVSKMPPLFRSALSLKMAMNMAYAFTQSTKDIERINALYENVIGDIMAVNGQERPPIKKDESAYILARKRI